MAETVLGNAIELLQDFGFFDVVLPFLLIFTIVFGMLEKTKIFGTEKIGDSHYPKKNINAMFAFVVAFFVIAAKEIVAAIQESLPLVSFILLAIVSFLMLVGSFVSGEKEFNFIDTFKGWRLPLAGVFTLAIIMIFFDSFGWLEPIYDYFSGQGNDVFIIAIFTLLVAGVVYFVFDAGKAPTGGSA